MASPFLEGCAFLMRGVGLALWIVWQVFGLMDVIQKVYWSSLPRHLMISPVLIDDVRFHLPLRDSPGVSPGSLLPRQT